MIIGPATNPTGARQAGPWTVRTESAIDGTFYKVDESTSQSSFVALVSFMESFW